MFVRRSGLVGGFVLLDVLLGFLVLVLGDCDCGPMVIVLILDVGGCLCVRS